MCPYGPTAILDAILNKKKCPNLIFTPPTENDPWDPYNDESSEKNTLTDDKGFTPLTPWLELGNIAYGVCPLANIYERLGKVWVGGCYRPPSSVKMQTHA